VPVPLEPLDPSSGDREDLSALVPTDADPEMVVPSSSSVHQAIARECPATGYERWTAPAGHLVAFHPPSPGVSGKLSHQPPETAAGCWLDAADRVASRSATIS